MAWALLIAAYSIGGGIFLLIDGKFLFFRYPEWQIYGGIGLVTGLTAVITIFALSNRSYVWTRAVKFLWPFVIVISAIRAIAMIVELQYGKDNLAWECNNGGQLWPPNLVAVGPSTMAATIPSIFCTTAFPSIYAAFILSLLIDLVCQIYMFFFNLALRNAVGPLRRYEGAILRRILRVSPCGCPPDFLHIFVLAFTLSFGHY